MWPARTMTGNLLPPYFRAVAASVNVPPPTSANGPATRLRGSLNVRAGKLWLDWRAQSARTPAGSSAPLDPRMTKPSAATAASVVVPAVSARVRMVITRCYTAGRTAVPRGGVAGNVQHVVVSRHTPGGSGGDRQPAAPV